MENSKYYTPSWEEIHIGFECEIMEDGVFTKRTVENERALEYTAMMCENGDVRVKHLDREDIESLGWEAKDVYVEGITFLIGKHLSLDSHNPKYGDPTVTICKVGILGDYRTVSNLWSIFRGEIKNKSELRMIMKMLKID